MNAHNTTECVTAQSLYTALFKNDYL